MNKFNIDSRKLIGTIIGSIAFICCILFFTYAWYTWKGENITINGDIIDEYGPEVLCEPNTVNVTNIGPILNIEDAVEVVCSVVNPKVSSDTVGIYFNVSSISNNLKDETFKYSLLKSIVSYDEKDSVNAASLNYSYDSPVASGNFKNVGSNSNLTIANETLGGKTVTYYKFILYIDGSVPNNLNMRGNSLNGNVFINWISND